MQIQKQSMIKVVAALFLAVAALAGCRKNKDCTPTLAVATLPTLTTTVVSGITFTTGNGGGNISADGGASVTARGVVWSLGTTPTIALSTKTTDGTGTGAFTSAISGLTPNTIYYVRAYATNSAGTAYGNEVSFRTGS